MGYSLDLKRLSALKEDIISLSREKKISSVLLGKLTIQEQKEIKKFMKNYNDLIKISMDILIEIKDYAQTSFNWNESDDKEEYNALLAILEE